MTLYDKIMTHDGAFREAKGLLGLARGARLSSDATYTQLKFSDRMQAWLGRVKPEFVGKPLWEGAETHLMTAYALWKFEMGGKKVYEISQALCKKFEATHIKKVPTELLKMPYLPAILIEVPKNTLKCVGPLGESTFVRSIFICEVYEKLNHSDTLPVRMLRVAVSDENYFVHFWIPLDKLEVHECVDRGVEIIEQYMKGLNGVVSEEYRTKEENTFDDTAENTLRWTFEFVMKCLLYITGEKSDIVYCDGSTELYSALKRVKSPGKRKEIQRRITNIGLPKYRVGSKIILTREERQGYEMLGSKGFWKLSYRFLVQGHFRNQACGEWHKERKVIFIDPFFKGPELAEVVNKTHVVK